VVAAILDMYVALRDPGEPFIETLRRVGVAPFKAAAYPAQDETLETVDA
jgi:sulfite reductase (NADPH) hemoprotein beta-component